MPAVFEDAFRHPRDALDGYAFPPFPLISRVVGRVRHSSRLTMYLVCTPLVREGVVRRPSTSTEPTTSHPPLLGQSASAASLHRFHQGVHVLNFTRGDFPATLLKVGPFEGGCWCIVWGSLSLRLVSPVEVVVLLWLVSLKGHCSSQRHGTRSRGFSNSLTPRHGFVRLRC